MPSFLWKFAMSGNPAVSKVRQRSMGCSKPRPYYVDYQQNMCNE